MIKKIYTWKGINKNGKVLTGKVFANNKKSALHLICSQNITIIGIQCKLTLRSRRITSKQLLDFMQQFSTLINSNIPIIPCLTIIYNSTDHSAIKDVIQRLKNDLKIGFTLSEAFHHQKNIFGTLTCNLFYAAEQSGKLDVITKKLAQYYSELEIIKSKIKKILLYPSVVLLVTFVITFILLRFVLPQFVKLYANFDAKLPAYTQYIINIANFVSNNTIIILTFIAAMFWISRYIFRRFLLIRIFTYNLLFKIPLLNKIIKKTILTKLIFTLSLTYSAGIPLSEALKITSKSLSNIIYANSLLELRKYISGGTSFSEACGKFPHLYPKQFLQMITIGEKSGTLDIMLNSLANQYEQEINIIINNLNNLLEPTIMVILGALLGGLIIGMYLPIFRLGTIL